MCEQISCVIFQTPNAEIIYELKDFSEADKQSRYFAVTQDGTVYKKLATISNTDYQTFSVIIIAHCFTNCSLFYKCLPKMYCRLGWGGGDWGQLNYKKEGVLS